MQLQLRSRDPHRCRQECSLLVVGLVDSAPRSWAHSPRWEPVICKAEGGRWCPSAHLSPGRAAQIRPRSSLTSSPPAMPRYVKRLIRVLLSSGRQAARSKRPQVSHPLQRAIRPRVHSAYRAGHDDCHLDFHCAASHGVRQSKP